MGRPYAEEIAELPSTYSWARQIHVGALADSLGECASLPLLCSGSGGSFTVAQFASELHERHTGRLAKAATPLQLVSSDWNPRQTAVLLLSASGSNTDAVAALRRTIVREPRRLVLVTKRPSQLSRIADRYGYVDSFDLASRTSGDGFLATNSLLAFCLVLARAYSLGFSFPLELPDSLWKLVSDHGNETEVLSKLRAQCQPLWARPTLLVLFGARTCAAAIDLESKMTEAALGSVQVSDFRNFAHGRHHWLAKRGSASAVLAFSSGDDGSLPERTLKLIPAEIPVTHITVPHQGTVASLAALALALTVTGFAGEARHIDPGRPGVPPFGRRLYNLRPPQSPSLPQATSQREAIAIERKSGISVDMLLRRGELHGWKEAHRAFVRAIEEKSYRAIVFDYDGTLCEKRDRYNGIREEIASELVRLLKGGIAIAVVTGRGKSVRQDLQAKLPPDLWSRVLMSYYNGSETSLLTDEACPGSEENLSPDLSSLREEIEKSALCEGLAVCTYRRAQITVEPKSQYMRAIVEDLVRDLVHARQGSPLNVVYSSHSVDILAQGVSKSSIVPHLGQLLGTSGESFLFIGDRGRWPGNDFALLKEGATLSVDEVSPDRDSCWNLAPPGHRGVQATLDYLSGVKVGAQGFRFVVRTSGRR